MFCIKCGEEVSDNVKFCPNCGNQISGESAAPEISNNTQVNNAHVAGENTHEVSQPVNSAVQNTTVNTQSTVQNAQENLDQITTGLSILSVVLPPFGIAYYFGTKKYFKNKAKGALKAGIFGLVTYAVAALVFIYLILPLEKKFIFSYECTSNTPGASYNMQTDTCTKPDGSEYQRFLK